MHITNIRIHNFRGLDIEIDKLDKDFLIIGKNDSGKTNICYAIRKVLDYNIRKYPLTENDSSNFNKGKISISLTFELGEISIKNKNKLGPYVEKGKNGEDLLNVYFEATFNKDLMIYEEKLFFGSVEREERSASTPNRLDSILEIIYVSPNYDIEFDKKYYFRAKREYALEKEENVREEIRTAIETLNNELKSDDDISSIIKDINDSNETSVFEDTGFEIQSNVDVSNIYKSLDIYPIDKRTNKRIGIGDGKNKTLSLLLQKMSRFSDKQKIFIVEEPENHLFPLLQKSYLNVTSRFNADQIIFTTHSPYIVDFKKVHQLIKLCVSYDGNNRITGSKSINIYENDYEKYGYLLNSELAEMFFYDKVLLVEGFSEKYFYNILYLHDNNFRKFINDNKIGVFAVNGIAFGNTKELLNKLGVTVYIKTDNDIYKKRGYYAGLYRCFSCLTKNDQDEVVGLLNSTGAEIKDTYSLFKCENDSAIKNNLADIIDIYYRNGVFLSLHHDGFERDFLEFVGSDKIDEEMQELKDAKLKNLHEYVEERNLVLSINEKNKDNVLVRFMKNEPKQ